MSIKQVINIANWAIERYESVKNKIKRMYRIHRSKKIRKAVDSGDIDTVISVLRDVKKRRRDNSDAS